MLPNYICPGAQKAGTSTLYALLKQHPDIKMSLKKEPGFFAEDGKFQKGLEWYEKEYFPDSEGYKIVGDMSTAYLNHAAVTAPRILESLGKDVRFIVILRNPARRAYSQYLMKVQYSIENETFERAIELEASRMAGQGLRDHKDRVWEFAYVENGYYARHIKEYLKLFPRENFKFIIFEDFVKDQKTYVQECFEFLGLDKDVPIRYDLWENAAAIPKSRFLQVHVVNKYLKRDNRLKHFLKLFIPQTLGQDINKALIGLNKKSYTPPKMNETTAKMLTEAYRADILELQDIIGKDLSAWLR